MSESQSLTRRLLPLYVAAFFQSALLWYPIEKLFMRSIGFSTVGIGLMVAAYSAVMLVVETPSGIIADRWSRKGMLMVTSICFTLSSLVGGLGHSVGPYILVSLIWGVGYACYSGLFDTIIYDAIAETNADSRLFDKLYGRVQIFESAALVLGAIVGGFLASTISLRFTYFASLPFGFIAILALLRFREPTLHKQYVTPPVSRQIKQTLRAVLRNSAIVSILVVLILRSVLVFTLFEFAQLWLIALHTPTQYYGIATAVLLASYGIAGAAVDRLRLARYGLMIITLVIMLGGFVWLIAFRNLALVVTAQFVATMSLIIIYVIFSRLLHDQLSADIRAGAASAASTLGRLFIIPLAVIFAYVSQRSSIFEASFIPLGLAVVMAIFVLAVARRNEGRGLMASETSVISVR